MLEVSGISVRFGGLLAVRDMSLSVQGGEFVGIIGPNGSGKSTFLNVLCGIAPATGSMSVDGHSVRLGSPPASRRAGVLRVFQAPQIFVALTCLENVMLASDDRHSAGLGAAYFRRRSMWRHEQERFASGLAALERVGLGGQAATSSALLSYGQQRLLELARAIAGHPRLLLLDEPSAGLNDSETDQLASVLEGLAGYGITVMLVDHKIAFVERLCPRIVAMELGQTIADGTPQEVWNNPQVADAYLGVEIADA
jgi:ABC-type branched-subunit amino acid transport system ATPase component